MDHDTYKSPLAGTPQPKRQVSKVPKPIRPIGGSAYVPRPQPSPSATPAPSQPHAADTRSDVPPEWVSLADPPEWIAAVHDIGAEAVRRDLLLAVAHGPLRFHHRIVGINPGISRLVPGLRVSAEGDCNRVVVRSWETVDAHWNGNAAGTVAGPAKEGRATRVVGLCGVVFLSLMGCQQSQPAPVMEEDLLACQQHPENHSVQFCDRITQAYRIYMGTAGSNSDQNAPTQTTRNKPRVARLASSERRVQSRDDGSPQPSKQLGANPFQARVATVYIAESFINEQLRQRLSNFELVKDLRMQLDPDSKRIFLEGLLPSGCGFFRVAESAYKPPQS